MNSHLKNALIYEFIRPFLSEFTARCSRSAAGGR